MKKLLLIAALIPAFFSNAEINNQRYSEQNRNLTQTPEVVFTGNSITDFWILNDPAFFADNNFADRGIGGETSIEIRSRFANDVVKLNPKTVVILAGINDIAENRGPVSNEHILANIKAMVTMAKAHNITPILCSILPCDRFGWNKNVKPAARVKEMNKLIKNLADEKGLAYVNYYDAFADENGALPSKYTQDGCHPNLDGYKIMEELVLKEIRKVSAR